MSATPDPGESTPTSQRDDAVAWHAVGVAETYERLGTDARGLSTAEAAARLRRHGPNELPDEPPTPWPVTLLRQLRSPLIYILIAATAVTFGLGEYVDGGVIAFVLVLNTAIGFTQERRAEDAVRALMKLVVPQARVLRDGHEQQVDSRQLVPGDVVLLEPGARVPADLRLAWTHALQVDESLLTGESLPPAKDTAPASHGAPLADRGCMAYTGTAVTSGRGRGVVVATGSGTELGVIADLIRAEAITTTPLQARMARLAAIIGVAVAIAATVAFVSGIALGGGAQEMFLTAVALAVAAVPEGLPVVLTITLALGVRRMARRNAIVRRLPAVETLGSATVIGSDKTGTLTENRMTVQRVWAGHETFSLPSDSLDALLGGDGRVPVERHPALAETLLAGVLTNEAEVYRADDELRVVGDPTEAALLTSAMSAGVEPEAAREAHDVLAEIPFEPHRRYSASLRTDDGARTLFVKGAPERVVDMCTHMRTAAGVAPIDHDAVHRAARHMAGEGLRVLAMASKRDSRPPGGSDDLVVPDDPPEDLVFLGLQGMMDPPRAGVADAVARCHQAGLRVMMITGDHAITARSIAHQLGIAQPDERVLTGTDLEAMSHEELRAEVERVSVYARVSPAQKLQIVRALQDLGHVVAVTGDGVNDAPALKAAAIGIAMGRSGTDVAREAADMVLSDDDFVSIAAAVDEGRTTFDNVRKVTFFLVSTGAATIVAILVGVWARWPLLMLPAQLLWLNLVTNGLQDIALAFEPAEPGARRRPPRRASEGILSTRLWQRAAIAGLVMAAGTLVLFRWELDQTGSVARAQSVALTTMVVFMAFHAGNARSETSSLLRLSPISNPFLLVATVAAVGVHAAALAFPPAQFVLRVEPIEPAAWVRIVAVAAAILVVMELDKALRRRPSPPSATRSPRRSDLEGGSDTGAGVVGPE